MDTYVLMQGPYVLFCKDREDHKIEWVLQQGPMGHIVDQGVGVTMEDVMKYCLETLRIVRKTKGQ